MIILRARDIPPDLFDFFELVQSEPTDVLSPSPEPFPGKHFAVFPSGLITDLIKATCPARCCPECGNGWSPIMEKRKADETNPRPFSKPGNEGDRNDVGRIYEETNSNVLGYRPTCGCVASSGMKEVEVSFGLGSDSGFYVPEPVPGVVLDPFFGAGTTGLVCDRLGLDCIGIDISEKYAVELAAPRIRGDAPLLAEVMVEAI